MGLLRGGCLKMSIWQKILVGVVLVILLVPAKFILAQPTAEENSKKYQQIQKKMLSTPDLVSPDSIYIGAELKSIYYQNAQIAGLLEEIKGLLKEALKELKEKE